LAGNLTDKHEVRILDLDLFSEYYAPLFSEIESFGPDVIASTVITPDYFAVREIMSKVKERYPRIKTIVGGVHITSLPEEVNKDRCFDVLVLGEGDKTIKDVLAYSVSDVEGIIYTDTLSGERICVKRRELVSDLNDLPYPAWHLFDLRRYKNSRLSSRRNPVGLIETSRGCAFQCDFCNKLTFGSIHRIKDPKRVVDEMEYMLKCGFKEIHIVDDSFTQEIDRAKEVCAEILRRGLVFPWSLINGVRADMVDLEFFKLAKKSGCWQTGFGIETGDQDVLDRIDKKIKLSDVENAVKLSGKAGINTFGFFILGLSGETERSMARTIEFSKKLPLDIAKFDICIPYPGTSLYKKLKEEGRMLSEDWSKYNCHQIEEPLFTHPNLSWDAIKKQYKKAFREFYLRPSYLARRFFRSLWMGDIFYDMFYFINTKW
jgi:radical SAM superfamily enzyme YgiQ (UPF0313 family)